MEGEPRIVSKKRKQNKDTWVKNVRKIKKLRGESYTSSRGQLMPPKTFLPVVCKCFNKCHNLIPDSKQKYLNSKLFQMDSYDLQSAFLFGLIKVIDKKRSYTKNQDTSRRKFTREYYLPVENGKDEKVCKDFFKKLFLLSDGRISRLIKSKMVSNTPPRDKRGKHTPFNKTDNLKIAEIKEFINKFPSYESHYSRIKNLNRKYLSPNLNLKMMYNLYKNDSSSPVSFYIFQEVFNKQFNLHFHAPISDSCKKCDTFNMKLKFSNDNEEKAVLENERELHQRKADSAREGLQLDGIRAKENDNITCIAFDLMKTLATPVLSTGICYYKRQLWTYCFGVHNLGNNDVIMYVWDESIASRGPQEVGSCILHYIKNYVTSQKLIMYSDQCGGQNRNIKMAVLCNYIVASPSFTVNEIDHKFLVSGHSFLPCDQDFGLIEKQKKCHSEIHVPDDWKSVITSARKKNPFQIVNMTKNDFFSTKSLEKQITNRKIDTTDQKVEWLKIQWLNYKNDQHFKFNYKYSNNSDFPFNSVYIGKRISKIEDYTGMLDLLYTNGHTITEAKKKDLLDLLAFIPPIKHQFYNNLKVDKNHDEDYPDPNEDEHSV